MRAQRLPMWLPNDSVDSRARTLLYWKALVRKRLGADMQIRVDVDRLREYMLDEYGTAAFGGFPAAAMDAWEIERMDGEELCREAEHRGIDLRDFQAW